MIFLSMIFNSQSNDSLSQIFVELNFAHFDGFLEIPILKWNSRLRSSAGRFIPGSRKYFKHFPPQIEIASYLITEGNAYELIKDTMGHEMIHYWLWVRKRPYGHTGEFLEKMRKMGVSRYNPVPKTRAFKYVYRCTACLKEFFAKRKLGPLACAQCCKQHSQGKYDARFKLYLDRELIS